MKKINIKQLFNDDCKFLAGAQNFNQIPIHNYPEIAFVGASNVGKSSLINAVVNKKIAITSKTPGRTRQLNFFILANQLALVDMPGFGYAKVSKTEIANWQKVSFEYLTSRTNLKRIFLLIDPVKGLTKQDLEIINIFNTLAASFQIIITKSDKVRNDELQKAIAKIQLTSKNWPALYPEILISSSLHQEGIEKIQEAIVEAIRY
jgi:GTP-binding protein